MTKLIQSKHTVPI